MGIYLLESTGISRYWSIDLVNTRECIVNYSVYLCTVMILVPVYKYILWLSLTLFVYH